VVASVQYRALAEKASDAFYKLSNTKAQIQAYVFDDSIDAMVFAAVSDQYYGIAGKDVDTSTMDGSLPLPLLKKLSEPMEYAIRLRAEMNNYGGLNQCKFIVFAIFDSSPTTTSASSKHSLMLDPPTPQKRANMKNPLQRLHPSTQGADLQTTTMT